MARIAGRPPRPIFLPRLTRIPTRERESHERPESRVCHSVVDEIADGIFRISTPVPKRARSPGRLYLQSVLDSGDDAEPLSVPTPARARRSERCASSIERVIPVDGAPLHLVLARRGGRVGTGSISSLRWVAPRARPPVCGQDRSVATVSRLTFRPTGRRCALRRSASAWSARQHTVQRIVTRRIRPTVGSAGSSGRSRRARLLCGDLRPRNSGRHHPAINTEEDILEPSEAARVGMDYYAHCRTRAEAALERLADTAPTTLAPTYMDRRLAWRRRVARCEACAGAITAVTPNRRGRLVLHCGCNTASFTQHSAARGARNDFGCEADDSIGQLVEPNPRVVGWRYVDDPYRSNRWKSIPEVVVAGLLVATATLAGAQTPAKSFADRFKVMQSYSGTGPAYHPAPTFSSHADDPTGLTESQMQALSNE